MQRRMPAESGGSVEIAEEKEIRALPLRKKIREVPKRGIIYGEQRQQKRNR